MFYPINLKIDDMKIVIIGGGKVAYRKCMNFLAFNKKVKVISQDFIEEFEEIKNEHYKSGYTDGERITKDLYRSDIVTMIKIFERLWR